MLISLGSEATSNVYHDIAHSFRLLSDLPLTRFYNAYIFHHFVFCCVIWGNCTSVIEDKLVKLQKRAARAILDVDFTLPSETMYTQLK